MHMRGVGLNHVTLSRGRHIPQARRENFLLIDTLVLIFGHQSGCIVIQITNN